jgi:chromosome segregation ATPase
VLYLAEVHKKSGFMGGNKAELKLLARQQSEQIWTVVPGEDTVPADAAIDFSQGNLVLVELSANRQIQNLQEAAKPLVVMLQNFSRMKEKFRTQEEEIEGWKQSLIYQSQELTRRELEMEARQEELQQMEADIQQFDQQRQELEQLRQQIEQERAGVETARIQVEATQQRLEGLQAGASAGLHPEQVEQIQQILQHLDQSVGEGNAVGAASQSLELVVQQQELLNHHWQSFEQQKAAAQQQQQDLERQASELDAAWQAWHQAQSALEQEKANFAVQQQTLTLRSQAVQKLSQQLQTYEDLNQQLNRAINGEGGNGSEVDLRALAQMPIAELIATVESLQKDLQRMVSFVQDQEEELRYQQQAVEELQTKIQQASEYERMTLAADLESEQHSYRLLNETLEGQRQRLRDRQSVFKKHQEVLDRRQSPDDNPQFDFDPVFQQIQLQRQSLAQELQALQAEVNQLQSGVQQAQDNLQQRSSAQESRRQELRAQDSDLKRRNTEVAKLWGQVNTYQESLQPIQDRVDALRTTLAGAAEANQMQQNGGSPKHLIDELKGLITSLGV